MIPLRNMRKTFLGRTADGRNRYALDCHIGAVQMMLADGEWRDIAPRLRHQGDNLVAEGTPYALEIKPNGTRIIWPKHDKSVYMRLFAPTVLGGLTATAEADRVVYQSSQREAAFRLTNTGVKFDMLLKEAPSFDCVTFDVDSAGLDIAALLRAKTGLGIPAPQLEEVKSTTLLSRLVRTIQTITPGLGVRELLTRPVEWKYKNGQLELGFDLTGMRFPVRLRNTTLDLQVGANADDDFVARSNSYWANTDDGIGVGYFNGTYFSEGASFRFTTVAIPNGATIDVAYLTFTSRTDLSTTTVNSEICLEDADNPLQITSYADHVGRSRTADVVFDSIVAWAMDVEYQSPSLVAPVQTVINRAGWVSGQTMIAFWEDRGNRSTNSANVRRLAWAFNGSAAKATKFYVEWSEAAGSVKPNQAIFIM